MATAHYARSTINVYEELLIRNIKQIENVVNVAQFRPIERFWYQLKQKVYENAWELKNCVEL